MGKQMTITKQTVSATEYVDVALSIDIARMVPCCDEKGRLVFKTEIDYQTLNVKIPASVCTDKKLFDRYIDTIMGDYDAYECLLQEANIWDANKSEFRF